MREIEIYIERESKMDRKLNGWRFIYTQTVIDVDRGLHELKDTLHG